MFSQHERRQLDEIEEWFEQSDPELARMLREGKYQAATRRLVACTGFAVGALLLLTGALSLSFVLIFFGVATVAGTLGWQLVSAAHNGWPGP
ncbi:DUF3040 domain-containing protein [Amycolatopsis suaedae]|uniref:DUF3040 domain-containing protein n=1 Tax=Amycolatopsis suaedae TaxID=2510978 RepID=A0A4V2EL66_9PSEU|nr:DUF3040 domain-containing protein [Amycolatopsis suaedae]RZQ60495.1 DUF3040 domain-containing protein [Amycolatopsis suaedae]